MIIYGKNINLRTVDIKDAEFIYEMRQSKDKVKYLSTVNGTIDTQKEWIKNYKIRENQQQEFYFVIESKNHKNLGLIRVYDLSKESFCWGSWIITESAPKTTAIESVLQIYKFGFYQLGYKKSHFDVRKGNKKVIDFHKRFGAKIVNENNTDYFFYFYEKDFNKMKIKYKRYL